MNRTRVSPCSTARQLLLWLTIVALLMMAWPAAAQEPDQQGDEPPDPAAKHMTHVIGGGQPVSDKSSRADLLEGFEDGIMPPSGWTHLQTNPNETWEIDDHDPYSGNYNAHVLYDPALMDQDEVLLSPTFTAQSGSVSLWSIGSLYWCRDTYDNCDLEIWFVNGTWDGGSADDIYLGLADDDWTGTWAWSHSSLDFSPYANGSPARIAFRYVGNDGAEIGLDDVTINYFSGTCNDPHESNDSRADATPISYGDTLADPDICPAGDVDYYSFSGSAGDLIVTDIDARSLSPSSQLDSVLYLLNSSGNELTHNDDHGSLDSYIEYTLPADGTYYLRVEEYNHPNEGGPDYFYTISLALSPSFDIYSNWTSNSPSIDGHISASEWSDAATYDITAVASLGRPEGRDEEMDIAGSSPQSSPRSSRSPVTLYVMNDGSQLYLAFDNPNDTVHHADDQIGIYFDDNPLPSDGQWTNTTCGHADGEGNFWVMPSIHKFREIIAGPSYCTPVEPAPGVDGTLQFTDGHAQAEVAIDLTSSALRAFPDDSINMYLWILDYDDYTQDGIWPIGTVWNDPATYQPLTLADPISVGPLVYDSHIVDDDNSGESSGDGDGIIECGETIELDVALHNQGSDTATGVSACISTSDPYITWPYNTCSDYPDIPSGGTEINTNDFDFEVDPNTPPGEIINFSLNIDADQGSWSDSFSLQVGGVGDVIVTIGDGNGSPGSTDNPVTISADNLSQNTTPIAAGEFRVVYDGSIGLTLVDVDTTARSAGFQTGWTQDTSNPSAVEAHIILYSLSAATISSGTGPILELLFDVDPAANAGNSSVLSFSRGSLSDQQGQPIPADYRDTGLFTIGCAKDGDINNDEAVDVFDLQPLINMILHSPHPDPNQYPLDWWCRGDLAPPPNGDSQWNILDLQQMIRIILGTCGSGTGKETPSRGDNVVSIQAEVNACPGTSGAFDIDCANDDTVSGAEVKFTYDSTIGLDITGVTTATRTDGWTVAFSKDANDPSAVEIHILLYNMSELEIHPGTGAILAAEYSVDSGATGNSPLVVTEINLADTQAPPQMLNAKGENGLFHVVDLHEYYLPLVVKDGSP